MKRQTRILARKVLNSFVTFLLVMVISFILFRMMPGDPVNMVVPNDPRIPGEYKEQLIEEFGLNKSMPEQFIAYVKSVLTLDFGNSFEYRTTPAMEYVVDYLRWTLVLVGLSSLLMIVFGMLIGMYAAWKRGGLFDTGSFGFSLFFYAMPTFWFAMMLIVMFAVSFPVFPAFGALDLGESFEWSFPRILDMLNHLILPTTCLTLVSVAGFSVIMRGALTDALTEDFIITAKAKGLSDQKILRKHALPNAMLPMVALIAIHVGFIVAGAYQTELVFDYPGIGWASIHAVYNQDWPVLQASFFIVAVCVILANLVADILLVYLDPRVKME